MKNKLALLFVQKKFSIEKIKDIVNLIQATLTILAAIAAAYWFLHQEKSAQMANVSHKVEFLDLGNGSKWVLATITIKNIGLIKLHIDEGEVYLQRVSPVNEQISTILKTRKEYIKNNGNGALTKNDDFIVKWPSAGPIYNPKDKDMSLFPSESEALHFEFIIPSEVETILLYSLFCTEKSCGKETDADEKKGRMSYTFHSIKKIDD